MTNEEMHEVVQYLYKLLDDIDTCGDIAKNNDKLYRTMVEKIQSFKGLVVEDCDGYTVTFKPVSKEIPQTYVDMVREALCGTEV